MNQGPLAILNRDARVLFAARTGRMFAYGFVSVILVIYLAALGFDGLHIGLLLTLTLVGDAAISLWLTTHADALGRRRVLQVGALLMAGAGIAFTLSGNFWILLVAATIGVISVSGSEVGPFIAVEQASLSHLLPARERTRVFAWYSLVGSFAVALGALAAGSLVSGLRAIGASPIDSDRAVVVGYALVGVLLWIGFRLLSPAIELDAADQSTIAGRLGLHRSRATVFRLSGLFGLDAFGGALVAQSLVAYWFTLRYGAQPVLLGVLFFVANVLAGLSALVAASLAKRIGLIRTMVFTHLPGNVLIIALPLMPNLLLAALVLFARFSVNQMDIPARQSYLLAVVDPDERSAAGGVTAIARTLSAAPAPLLSTPLIGVAALASIPFFVGGALKLTYDLALYILFRALHPPEEAPVITEVTALDASGPR
ncbi:MAG: MFS transporter [Candidatus Dormiibacterota bacterium]